MRTWNKTGLRVLTAAICTGIAGTALHAAENYKVDGAHSSVLFKVKHLNVSNFYGRFNEINGTFVIDEADPSKCSFEVMIPAESIDTGIEKRDSHLKSPDFFNVKQFPQITFKSTSVKAGADGGYEVTGDLTLHGQTKPVTVVLVNTGSGTDHRGTQRSGFESNFKIKRSDFGMDYMIGGLGDEIELIVAVETIKQS